MMFVSGMGGQRKSHSCKKKRGHASCPHDWLQMLIEGWGIYATSQVACLSSLSQGLAYGVPGFGRAGDNFAAGLLHLVNGFGSAINSLPRTCDDGTAGLL